MFTKQLFVTAAIMLMCANVIAQEHGHEHHSNTPQRNIEPQPLLAQAIRLKDAMSFLGSALSPADEKKLISRW